VLAVAVVLYLALRSNRSHARPLMAAALAPLIASGLLDAATWGVPFHSLAQNVLANLSGHRAQLNSHAPWFAYFVPPLRVWWPWTLPLAGLIALGSRGQRLLVIAAAALLATHSVIPHKEYRYVYLALALAIMLAALGVCELSQRLSQLRRAPAGSAAVCASLLLALGLYASVTLGLHYDYSASSLQGGSGEPPFMWTHFRGMLLSFEALSADTSVCGVGLENRDWSRSGGYTYLHRHVPLFEIHDNDAYKQYVAGFNVFIADASSPPHIGHFERGPCWDTVCIYRRPGSCVVFEGYDINQRLIARGD
jgi:phosphatidylinositol glycan class B